MSRRFSVVILIVVVAAFALAWRLGFYTLPGTGSPAAPDQSAAVSGSNGTAPNGASTPSGSGSAVPSGGQAAGAPGAAETGAGATAPSGAMSGSTPTAAAPAESAATTSTPPSFDVVRVDPDGSAVIAGRAAPNGTVSVTSGASTLAEVRANASGEFALDLALPAGEHRLRLAQGGAGGAEASLSDEAALVNVPPKGRPNDLLVMMERPGEASEVLVRPQVADSEGTAATPGRVDPAGSASPQEMASISAGSAPQPGNLPNAAMAPGGEPATQTRVPAGRAEGALAVEAVEIENGKLFIAGAANPKSTIRVYLDDKFVTEATGGAGDRFIASAAADVPVGDHVIRADEIGPNGEVISRVEVPFNRPNASSMSAVASAASASDQGRSLADAAPMSEPAGIEQAASPPSFSATDDARSMIAAASPDPLARAPAANGTGLAEGGLGASSPPVFVQAPLETVQSRVIIRRGDTLWRISRQTYGRGSRYTVIYLANGDQIRDPNRIYPGQVFRMPEDEAKAESRG